MKNLLAILGVSFLLVGCFDDSKKQDADSSQIPVEQKPLQTGEKSSVQRSEEEKASSNADEDKKDVKYVSNLAKETKPELVKINKSAEQHRVIEKHDKSEKNVAKKVLASASNEVKFANKKTKRSATKQKSAKRRQNVDGTYENGKLISNLSPEELRVGAQVPMSENEIRQEKMQCRYPFMSQQEIAENNCGVKKVTISY